MILNKFYFRRLGSLPNKVFPRDALDDQLRRFGRFGILMGIWVIPLFVSDPEDSLDFELIALRCKECRDDPTKEFDTNLVELTSESKKKQLEDRWMGVFEDMYRLGYI